MDALLVADATGDCYFVGDLEAGITLAKRERYTLALRDDGQVRWFVFLGDGPLPAAEAIASLRAGLWPANVAEWGSGRTKEEAWRFALGAHFGPDDDGYDEAALRTALTGARS